MTAAKEVSASDRCRVPGAASPGAVGEFGITILAYGLRGNSTRKGGDGRKGMSLRFTSGLSHLSGCVLWNLCVGVVSMATRHLPLVVLMVILPAALFRIGLD